MTKTALRVLLTVFSVLASSAGAQPSPGAPLFPVNETELPPELLIDVSVSRLFRGWPLVLTVYLRHGERAGHGTKPGDAGSLVIDAQQGELHRLLHVEMVRVDKESRRIKKSSWPLRPLGELPRRVALRPGGGAALVARLVLPAAESLALSPATYFIRVHIDSRAGTSAESWKGTRLVSVEMPVLDEPPVLDANLACEKVLANRKYLLATGQGREALGVLDELLSRTPDNAAEPCWVARAELHERDGNVRAARDDYCKAARAESEDIDAAYRESAHAVSRPTIARPRYSQACQELNRRLVDADAGTPAGK